jgi:hypothetical protein
MLDNGRRRRVGKREKYCVEEKKKKKSKGIETGDYRLPSLAF